MTSCFKSLTPDEVSTLFYIFEVEWETGIPSVEREGGGHRQEGPARRARLNAWKDQMGKGPSPSERADDTTKAHSISLLKMDSDEQENRAFSTFPMAIVREDNFRSVSEDAWEHPSAYEMVDNREFYLQHCALELRQRFDFYIN